MTVGFALTGVDNVTIGGGVLREICLADDYQHDVRAHARVNTDGAIIAFAARCNRDDDGREINSSVLERWKDDAAEITRIINIHYALTAHGTKYDNDVSSEVPVWSSSCVFARVHRGTDL